MNNYDIDKIFSTANEKDKKNAEKEAKLAMSKLNDDQKAMLNNALNDKDYLNSLLSSPGAKEIMKKFGIKEDK